MMKLKMIAVPTAFAMAFGLASVFGAAPAEAAAKTPEQLLKTCKMCHPKNPKAGDLTKLTEQHILDKLKAYRSGEINNSAMKGVAKKLSDEQMAGISALLGQGADSVAGK